MFCVRAMQSLLQLLLWMLVPNSLYGVPSEPHWFEQSVDHFSTSTSTFRQRYYSNDNHFGGPGSPIFVIIGGEMGIDAETGIYYPWVLNELAKIHKALVIEPEHRFYGESLPFGADSFSPEHLKVMNSFQALADIAAFIRSQQTLHNCTARGTVGYCPVLTIGGSYPGILSTMLRLHYPAVVDMAYAGSAPIKIFSQELGQYEFYTKVTETAEKALPGCARAVKAAFQFAEPLFSNGTVEELVNHFSICTPVPADVDRNILSNDLFTLVALQFATGSFTYYPPGNGTFLYQACAVFVEAERTGNQKALIDAMSNVLHLDSMSSLAPRVRGRMPLTKQFEDSRSAHCLDYVSQLPAGAHPAIRCGDWSGCGPGRDGESWDYQACTFGVMEIGFGTKGQMFTDRPWSIDWLRQHCDRRFGVEPRPRAMTELLGLDEANLRAQASRILFTNGLNDGWSAGAILKDLAPEKGLITINLPNGAHHSDLSHDWPMKGETPDVTEAHARISDLVGEWIKEVGSGTSTQVLV